MITIKMLAASVKDRCKEIIDQHVQNMKDQNYYCALTVDIDRVIEIEKIARYSSQGLAIDRVIYVDETDLKLLGYLE